MKKSILILFLLLYSIFLVKAQLAIYQEDNQKGASGICQAEKLYIGKKIPSKLSQKISSISLKKGYMATLSENEDGSGKSITFVAAVSDININLNADLKNKVSFIKVLPFYNVSKKGGGFQDIEVVKQLNVAWYYNWGLNGVSTNDLEFVPMAWGKKSAEPEKLESLLEKEKLTSILSFNEPDNKDQSNILVENAIPSSKSLLSTGYRIGSPATTEAQAFKWLNEFVKKSDESKQRIDFIAIHWYDWGGWFQKKEIEPDPQVVFKRFKAYIDRVYNLYHKPIWITEFNANKNTSEATHLAFMKLALPWLESDPRIERYAYFFPPALQPTLNGKLTPIGKAYQDFKSSPSLTKNIIN